MKSLKSFGVKELNTDEIKKTNGGNPFPWLPYLAIAIIAYDAIDGLAAGIKEEAAKG
ncbi:hypothetical protein [uncultured Tenacibaculum sp.]|uniref:hypothetical protein n=1 Tax=uncultured Tenacibaculum sp. TaxID=174713 RepID=UPI002606DD3B|nr:hypothetical protein [uncultured Tenacibaculum sp.]